MLFEIDVLKNFAIFTGKRQCSSLYLKKVARDTVGNQWNLPLCLQLYWKETPTQLFSCEYCEVFKGSFFIEHLLVAASKDYYCPWMTILCHWFFQYSLKNSENLWFSHVFRGHRKRPMPWNGLNNGLIFQQKIFNLIRN